MDLYQSCFNSTSHSFIHSLNIAFMYIHVHTLNTLIFNKVHFLRVLIATSSPFKSMVLGVIMIGEL